MRQPRHRSSKSPQLRKGERRNAGVVRAPRVPCTWNKQGVCGATASCTAERCLVGTHQKAAGGVSGEGCADVHSRETRRESLRARRERERAWQGEAEGPRTRTQFRGAAGSAPAPYMGLPASGDQVRGHHLPGQLSRRRDHDLVQRRAAGIPPVSKQVLLLRLHRLRRSQRRDPALREQAVQAHGQVGQAVDLRGRGRLEGLGFWSADGVASAGDTGVCRGEACHTSSKPLPTAPQRVPVHAMLWTGTPSPLPRPGPHLHHRSLAPPPKIIPLAGHASPPLPSKEIGGR